MSYNDNGYSHNNYQSNGGPGGGGYGGGGGGGGYGGGAGFSASQTTPGGGEKKSSSNVLRPCTIKQILDASQTHPDAPFQSEGAEILHVTFVAKVVNVSSASTHITYKFDDETGVIEVKKWIDADAAEKVSEIQNGMLARVLGNLKSFNGKRSIASTVIRPVSNEKEMAYHALESKYATMYLTRGPLGEDAPANNNAGGNSYGQTNTDGNGGNGEVSATVAQLDPFSRKVYDYIQKHGDMDDNGVHMRLIMSAMGGSGDIQHAMQTLAEEGIIYTTSDDECFKAA